jgi:alpha-ketoglutaric semialdehyde dehydrogenase
MLAPVLIDGQWRPAAAAGSFASENPLARQPLSPEFPISSWSDIDAALASAASATEAMRDAPGDSIGRFLDRYAERIEARKDELVALAATETALPVKPRLANVELPRTCGQLRLAAAAARDGSWRMATIDSPANIRSCFIGIGPVCVFGPNNFPFAFNSVAGGDFAAAIAAGNPVIAKANSSHPGVTRMLAEEAHAAVGETGLPAGAVQLLYRTSHADGERLVADPRIGAIAYTGSRSAGLTLKRAADAAGKPIYLELSSVNPVVILPGALEERLADIADQFSSSCLMGTGQFCTNPGMLLLLAGEPTERFLAAASERFGKAPAGTLLSKGVASSLEAAIAALKKAGAEPLVEAATGGGQGYSRPNTLLRVSGDTFLEKSHELQTEAFGNASLAVVARDVSQAAEVLDRLEGNLTGCVYSHTQGADDDAYEVLVKHLRPRVGRLLNDKMPTGVAVSAAMNHGGPYPATGHPGFTAVGIPASLTRFAMLACYDGVRPGRLPPYLEDKNPPWQMWRRIDGAWSQGDVG